MKSAVIVGAGCFGAALAHRLAGEGWTVTLVEQAEPGHAGASSGGPSRLMRFSHGDDPDYTRSARRARDLWLELEAESGRELIVESGLVWFARREGGWEDASEATLRSEGIPVERHEPGRCAEMFPSFDGSDLEFVVHEPDAGVLRARRCVETLAERAVERGARLVRGRAAPAGEAVEVAGTVLEADHFVWACGAWLGKLFPGVVEIRASLQDVTFFEAAAEWHSPAVPGWVDYDGAWYGCGALDGRGFKAATDLNGAPTDPDIPLADLSPGAEQSARRYLATRFPDLAGAPLARSGTCRYELTLDGEFLMAPHPEHPRVWLLGGGSGHGLKHAPALAEAMHALLDGRAEPQARHALGGRVPRRSLRTAGGEAG